MFFLNMSHKPYPYDDNFWVLVRFLIVAWNKSFSHKAVFLIFENISYVFYNNFLFSGLTDATSFVYIIWFSFFLLFFFHFLSPSSGFALNFNSCLKKEPFGMECNDPEIIRKTKKNTIGPLHLFILVLYTY